MKIAIISCQHLPNGVTEDQPLFEALKQHKNIEYQVCIWDDISIDWSVFDACLLRSVWDYHEKSTAFFQWIKDTSEVTKVINSADTVLWNSNKYYLKELEQAGLPIAPTLWLTQNTFHDLSTELKKLPPSAQYFLKPVIGADSSGTCRFNANQLKEAQTHLNQWLVQHDLMLQSYIPSVESYGEVSAIYFGHQFSHAIRKTPVAGDYRVQDTFGASDQAHQLTPDEHKVSTTTMDFLLQKFGSLCYARIDLLINDQQAVINEVELIEPSLFFHHNPKATQMFINQLQLLA